MSKEKEELRLREVIENNWQYEIIKRLDVIGDMWGDITRDNELRFKKEKMENAKREYEMWHQEYNGYRNDYKNTYRERI